MRVLLAATLLATLGYASVARGDIITWMIEVDQSEYLLGETVTWTASLNATELSVSDFGLATAQASLTESATETLSTATPLIAGGYLVLPGTAGAGSLAGFGPAFFGTDAAGAIESSEDAVFTPVATGTFTANVLGPHTLTLTPDPGTSRFFSSETGIPAPATTPYDSVAGDFTNFNVSAAAVPEPSSLVFMSIAAIGVGGAGWRRRRRCA